MHTRRETPALAPLSAEDASLGRLRWIVALALVGLIIVAAAFQFGVSKLHAGDQPAAPATGAAAADTSH